MAFIFVTAQRLAHVVLLYVTDLELDFSQSFGVFLQSFGIPHTTP